MRDIWRRPALMHLYKSLPSPCLITWHAEPQWIPQAGIQCLTVPWRFGYAALMV